MTVRIRLKRQKRRSSFLKSGCSCGGFEAVLRKRTKKKSPENRKFTGLFGGELGIRTLEAFRLTAFRVLHLRPLGQLSVYVIPFSFEKLFARTDGKNNKIFNFRTEQKLSVYGGFEGSILPNSQKISSQSRYDRFDTPAYIFWHRLVQRLEKCEISMQDNDERLGTRHPIKPAVMGFPADKVTCRMQTFECSLLRPLGECSMFWVLAGY